MFTTRSVRLKELLVQKLTERVGPDGVADPAGEPRPVRVHGSQLALYDNCPRKVDVRLPGKVNSDSHGARPVHLIIRMIEWIRTSRLPIKNSLSQIPLENLGPSASEAQVRFYGRIVVIYIVMIRLRVGWLNGFSFMGGVHGRGTTRAEDAQGHLPRVIYHQVY